MPLLCLQCCRMWLHSACSPPSHRSILSSSPTLTCRLLRAALSRHWPGKLRIFVKVTKEAKEKITKSTRKLIPYAGFSRPNEPANILQNISQTIFHLGSPPSVPIRGWFGACSLDPPPCFSPMPGHQMRELRRLKGEGCAALVCRSPEMSTRPCWGLLRTRQAIARQTTFSLLGGKCAVHTNDMFYCRLPQS